MRNESERGPTAPETPELAALLAAARRAQAPATDAELRATAAFRAARDGGAHAVRPPWWRRRDDWRPAYGWRGVGSVRVMAGGLVAAVLLGGVAVAAGQGVLPTPFGDGDESPAPDSVRPTQGAPETPGVHRTGGSGPSPVESPTPPGTPTAATSAPRSPHPHPLASEDRSRDEAALCRVYTKDRDHGKAADAEAFDRLRAAASDASDAAVTAYCEALLGRREPGPQGNSGETAAPAAPAASDGPAASHGSHGGGSGKGGPERPEAPGGRAPGGTVGGGPEGAASGGRNGAAVR